jgi:hypothetical protein
MSDRLSKFEITAKKGGFLNFRDKEILKDTITVPRGVIERLPLARGIDSTRLYIKHFEDGGAMVELDNVPVSGNAIDGGIYELKNKAEKFYKMESWSNINFPDPHIETDIEVPTIVGSLRVKVRRIS